MTGPSCCTSAARSRWCPRCRSSTATTCPAPTPPGSPGSAWRSRRTPRCPPADDQAEHRRRGHRRVGGPRPRQHRPGRGDAGDGGKGRAVQAVRRGRRLAGGARHPGHRPDRRDRPLHRARIRRDQSRGHRRPTVFRDRAPAAGAAGHPGVPRRPARHRDRGAGGADQCAAGGEEGAQGRPGGGQRRRRGRPGDHPAAAPSGFRRHHRLRPARRHPIPATRTSTSTAGGSPTPPIPAARRARWPRCWSAPTSSSGCRRRTC